MAGLDPAISKIRGSSPRMTLKVIAPALIVRQVGEIVGWAERVSQSPRA
jgi:hypothetical protein